MQKDLLVFAALLLALALLMLAGGTDSDAEDKDLALYCEMVQIWESDPRPEADRAGWPNFDNITCGE